MPIDFPTSPTTNEEYSYGDITWRWNGKAWEKITNRIVTRINGITGGITLAAGSGITLSSSGQTIIISSTGTSSGNTVTSFNGATGAIIGVNSWNGQTGAVTFNQYVASFGGKTGTVGAGITTNQILYWSGNDVTGSNNFTFDNTDTVTLADTLHFTGRFMGPVLLPIKNLSGGILTRGTPVYAVGSVGASGEVEVDACNAANSATMPGIGLVADASLGINGEGHAVVFGNLKDVNTSEYSINGTVFIAGVTGGLTGIRPSSANELIQNIGRVTRVHATTGNILVSAIGRSNDVPNIVQVRSYLQMPDGMTATGLVRSFNGLTGAVTGVTAVNAGSGISITGTTNPTITNVGVTGVNGLTGGLTVSGGTGMSVLSGGRGITLVNTGVLSINGSTGAVTNVARTNVDNSFSASQTISAIGAQFAVVDTNTANYFEFNPATKVITSYDDVLGEVTSLKFNNSPAPIAIELPAANTTLAGLAVAQTFTANQTFSTVGTFNAGITASGLTLNGPLVASRVGTFNAGITTSGITLNGTIVSSGLGTFNAGITASGITLNGTIIASGLGTFNRGITASGATFTGPIFLSSGQGLTQAVTSFNGATGAVTGASLGANTFTALNTFNAGISSAGGTFSSLTRFTAGLSAAGITTSSLRVTGTSTFDGDVSASIIRQNGPFPLYIQNFVDTIYIGDGLGEGSGNYFAISDISTAAELSSTGTFNITAYTLCNSPDQTAGAALTVNTDSSIFGAGNCFQVTNTFNSSTPVQISAAGAMTLTGRLTASGGITTAGINATGITLSSGGPEEGEVLTAIDTSGTATWRLPSTPMHYSGSATAYYLQPWNSTAPANTATTVDNTLVYYIPFWLQSTVQVRPAVMSSTTTPGVTGTVYTKVFNASRATGAPTGTAIGTFNNITITTGGNTVFVSPAPGITLNAGWYWIGVNFERNATNIRRSTFTTTHPFHANTFGISTPSTGVVFYGFTETVSAGSGVPSSVGTISENLSTAAAPGPTIMLRVV